MVATIGYGDNATNSASIRSAKISWQRPFTSDDRPLCNPFPYFINSAEGYKSFWLNNDATEFPRTTNGGSSWILVVSVGQLSALSKK
jgi:hypothetical protein